VQLFRQVLLAVQHAHANLVIHRDLKPANILVTPQGEVRLLDFGIAKLLEAEGDAIAETELTRQSGRSMTPRYASPEQLTGLPLTTACDVYSLGVVFYELMCGERPYELKVESAARLEHAILEAEPRPMSRRALGPGNAEARATSVKALRRGLSPELDAIALRCLAKHSSARYASVDAALADLDRWLAGEAVLARSPSTWYRWTKFAARHRVSVGLGLTAVLSLAVTATVAIVFAMQAQEESERALAARDFMLSLFKRADQEKARGADITARELLETGRKDLITRLQAQPRLQAELLQGIANIQKEMGEYVGADSTFADAQAIYSGLGMEREAMLTRLEHADNAVRIGDLKRAESLLRRAQDLKSPATDDAELRARFGEVEGWLANMQGDAVRARALFANARRESGDAFGADSVRALEALRGLIFAERQLRDFDSALALQAELETATARLHKLDPKALAQSDVERAELLYFAGRYAEGLSHAETAMRRCAEVQGPNDERCRRLMLNKQLVALRLGMVERARDDLAVVDELAQDVTSPTVQNEAMFLAFRLHSLLGRSPRQRELADRLRLFGQSGEEVKVNPALKARALLALAESSLWAREPLAAQRWIDMAFAQNSVGTGTSRPPSLVDAVGAMLSGIASLQLGEPDRALSLLGQAHDRFSVVMGKEHPMVKLFSLNTALALDAAGRTAEALSAVKACESVLARSFGTTSPVFARVQQMKNTLERKIIANQPTTPLVPIGKTNMRAKQPASIDFFS